MLHSRISVWRVLKGSATVGYPESELIHTISSRVLESSPTDKSELLQDAKMCSDGVPSRLVGRNDRSDLMLYPRGSEIRNVPSPGKSTVLTGSPWELSGLIALRQRRARMSAIPITTESGRPRRSRLRTG